MVASDTRALARSRSALDTIVSLHNLGPSHTDAEVEAQHEKFVETKRRAAEQETIFNKWKYERDQRVTMTEDLQLFMQKRTGVKRKRPSTGSVSRSDNVAEEEREEEEEVGFSEIGDAVESRQEVVDSENRAKRRKIS